jgi:hypothetical protein
MPGEGKTTYTFSISVNAFSVEFPLACYQQAERVWYISRALRRTYMLFYPAPTMLSVIVPNVAAPIERARVTFSPSFCQFCYFF